MRPVGGPRRDVPRPAARSADLCELEAGDPGAFCGQPVVLAGWSAGRVRVRVFPLRVRQALLLQAGEHRVQGAAGQPRGLHQVIAVMRRGWVRRLAPSARAPAARSVSQAKPTHVAYIYRVRARAAEPAGWDGLEAWSQGSVTACPSGA